MILALFSRYGYKNEFCMLPPPCVCFEPMTISFGCVKDNLSVLVVRYVNEYYKTYFSLHSIKYFISIRRVCIIHLKIMACIFMLINVHNKFCVREKSVMRHNKPFY